MREIKFRAWNGVMKIMSEPFDLVDSMLHEVDFIDGSIYLQFTGLKDKNCVEIYEGDIVKFKTYSGDKIREVEWDDDGMWLPFRDDEFIQDEQGDWFKSGFEVIGNIYGNKELMEG